jgi:RHS repeat-associated protein
MKSFFLLLLTLCFFASSCNDSSDSKVTDKLDDSFSTDEKPGDVQVSSQSFKDYHKIDSDKIIRKLDILLVPDTSSSIKEERANIARGFHNLLNSLPPDVDYNIGVLLAHGPNSNVVGKLYKKNNEPTVLKSEDLEIEQIKTYLDLKIHKPKEDGASDGGEMGMYALLESLKPENLNLIKSQGLFRSDAALAVVFIADEQDICAKFPDGVTPVVDKQNGERKMFVKHCIEEVVRWQDVNIGSSEYTYKITPELVHTKLTEVYGSNRLVVGGVIYNENSILPVGNEDEIGYGYKEIIELAGGISIDLATGEYGDGLSKIGRLAGISEGIIEDTFILKTQYTDSSSIKVYLDGVEFLDWTFDEGTQSITLAKDRDLLSLISIEYSNDTTLPVINFPIPLEEVSSSEVYTLSFNIEEEYFDRVEIVNNNNIILTQTDKVFNDTINLNEGQNELKLVAYDKAGNMKTLSLGLINLDSTPPVLISSLPVNDSLLREVEFDLKLTFDEKIKELLVEGVSSTLPVPSKSFTKKITVLNEGQHSLEITAIDIAGNAMSFNYSFEISLKLLQKELIQIQQGPFGLQIIGSAGATYPNVELELKTGLFEKVVVQSNPDGSFAAEVPPFSTIDIYAEDLGSGREEEIEIENDIDISLAGVVKDSRNNPIPGVSISISGTELSTITDASGVFKISNPVTGLQKIVIDGSTSPLNSELLKYPKTTISYNIGAFEKNVLENIVYLTPMNLLNAIEVSSTSSTTISNPDLPDVELVIPAGVTTFPDGSSVGSISVEKVSSDRISLPPPSFAVPSSVYVLEPSGVEFSQPVKVTLPNDNNFPEGIDLIILSKNSVTGSWEIDGKARVDAGGSTLTTMDGQGITHFSDIFPVPVFPKTERFDNSILGADTFKNSLSRSISLPKYQAFNQKFGIDLFYNSQYANPSPVITNTFKVPTTTIQRDPVTNKLDIADYDATQTVTGYTQLNPVSIEGRMQVADVDSGWFEFGGVVSEDSVVSFGVDLSSLSTGIYPYTASYKINFENLVVQTRNISVRDHYRKCVWKWVGYVCKKKWFTVNIEPITNEQKLMQSVFPDDLVGQLAVVNKSKSPFGKGWSVSGVQSIVDPFTSQILIDEGDSKLSIFNPEITVEKIKDGEFDSVSTYENELIYSDKNGNIFKRNIDENSNEIEILNGSSTDNTYYYDQRTTRTIPQPGCTGRYCPRVPILWCQKYKSTYKLSDRFVGMIPVGGDQFYSVDGQNAFSYVNGSSSTNLINGGFTPLSNTFEDARFGAISFCNKNQDIVTECQDNLLSEGQISCGSNFAGISSGKEPKVGYQDGSFSSALFNRPRSISPGIGNSFIVADLGNNVVRRVDIASGQVSTIVGNGNSSTFIQDGADALNIAISKPVDAKYDNKGNFYVLNQDGWLVRIDSSNKVKIIIRMNANGILPSYPIDETYLRNPDSFVIDNENNTIYVADTYNHRVLKLDLDRNLTTTIAGTGICQNGAGAKNKVNALEANLCFPESLALSQSGNLYVQDSGNKALRKINFAIESGNELTYFAASMNGEKIIKNSDDTFDRVNPDGSYIKFDQFGKQIESVTNLGLKTIFSYNASGFLDKIIDPNLNETQLAYSNGVIDVISDFGGRTTTFNVSDGELVSYAVAKAGSVPVGKNFIYDSKGQLTSEYNQNGDLTNYFYTDYNKLGRIVFSDGSDRKFQFGLEDTIAGNPMVSDSSSLKSIEGYNIKDTLFDGNGNSFSIYDLRDQKMKVFVDDDGVETTMVYKADGNVDKILYADSSFVEFDYYENGDVKSKYDSKLDASELYEFNNYRKLVKHTNFKGQIKSIIYNDLGQKTSEIGFEGHERNWVYNDIGQVIKSYNDDAAVFTSYIYNDEGNLSSKSLPGGLSTSIIRDVLGNIEAQYSDLSSQTHYTYNTFNQITSVSNGVDSSDPLGKITSYFYTPSGKLSRILDPAGNEVSYEFDSLDRKNKVTNQFGDTYLLTYDGNSNIKTEKDFKGNFKQHFYDNKNRKIQTVLPDDTYNLGYDSNGNLDYFGNNTSSVTYEYGFRNGRYLITSETTSIDGFEDSIVSFDISNEGQLDKINSNWGEISFGYNTTGQVTSFNDLIGENYNITYTTKGLLRSHDNVSRSIASVLDYNSSDQLVSINNQKSSNSINFFSYGYDSNGLISSEVTTYGSQSFTYDSELQLRTVNSTELGSSNETFDYDENGNLISLGAKSFNVDAKKQRLVSDYKFIYIYDSSGNLTTKTEKENNSNLTNYIHNSLNQLVQVNNYLSGVLVSSLELSYDALGRRVKKVFTSSSDSSTSYTEKYGYIGTDIVSIMNDESEVMAKITHSNIQKDLAVALHVTDKGVGRLAKQAKSYYYLRNNIGSVIDIVDSTGSIEQHYIYNSYGEILDVKDNSGNTIKENENVKTLYAFANSFYDSESKLYHNSLRYYDPATGRFIQVDPDPGHITNPKTVINKYIYSLNNPKNFRDPSGANIFEDFVNGLANSVVAVVNGLVNSIGPFIDGLGEILSSEEFRVALIIVAAVLTGGVAAAGLSGFWAYAAGAIAGGVSGAFVGSFHAQLSGDDPQEWLKKGFQIGFVAGGISGINGGFGIFDPTVSTSVVINKVIFAAGCVVLGYLTLKYLIAPAAMENFEKSFELDKDTPRSDGGQSSTTPVESGNPNQEQACYA